MKIALICFTENGFQMEKRLVKLLEAEGHGPCPWVSGRYATVSYTHLDVYKRQVWHV